MKLLGSRRFGGFNFHFQNKQIESVEMSKMLRQLLSIIMCSKLSTGLNLFNTFLNTLSVYSFCIEKKMKTKIGCLTSDYSSRDNLFQIKPGNLINLLWTFTIFVLRNVLSTAGQYHIWKMCNYLQVFAEIWSILCTILPVKRNRWQTNMKINYPQKLQLPRNSGPESFKYNRKFQSF